VNYPSLLRRYLATVIDLIVVLFLLFLYAHSPLYHKDRSGEAMWPLLLFLVYEPLCNRFGTTIGQFAMRFRVRTVKGHKRVPLWRGLIRVVTKYLLGIFSFIRMPIQKQRRALHDLISGTIALDVRTLYAPVPAA
jgi:uncharacterized RDD family membrane protein YckC